jgi:hypothetical protein
LNQGSLGATNVSLPNLTALYLGAGVVGGIPVSLLMRPGPKPNVEAPFLLLKTPLGREDILRRTGLALSLEGVLSVAVEEARKPARQFEYDTARARWTEG